MSQAGGNAGNQASVRGELKTVLTCYWCEYHTPLAQPQILLPSVIRGLALGTLNEQTQAQFLWRELRMALSLSAILSLAGFVRAIAFATPLPETVAVTSALALIVFSSVCLGAVLPLVLKKVGVDPAHSSTTIQVVMDILGVVLTVIVSSVILDSPIGSMMVSKLGGRG